MITINSLSGGKTSSYMAMHYEADYNIFSLIRVEDKTCLWMNGKDEKTRQLVSDKIGKEFIGTVEMENIIYTILDLEQFLGKEIIWVTGNTFEQIIKNSGNYLPNKMARFCTSEMKLKPIFDWCRANTELPVEMRIGYRPTEKTRVESIKARANEDGIESFNTIVGEYGSRNKWGDIPYRKVTFPLYNNNITKDVIYHYWSDKPVRFAYRNNCVGCVNRQPMMISHLTAYEKNKVEWFAKQEELTGNRFLSDVSFNQILKFSRQGVLFDDDDFTDCDSGGCGM
jgi:hypothetical protein